MLPQWFVILIIILILVLDVLLVLGLAALAILFATFGAGKLAYFLANKVIDRLVYAFLSFLKGLLESPPMNRAPILLQGLAGVKFIYDVINRLQNGANVLITVAVVLLTFALGAAAVGLLALMNAAALWLAWSYHLI